MKMKVQYLVHCWEQRESTTCAAAMLVKMQRRNMRNCREKSRKSQQTTVLVNGQTRMMWHCLTYYQVRKRAWAFVQRMAVSPYVKALQPKANFRNSSNCTNREWEKLKTNKKDLEKLCKQNTIPKKDHRFCNDLPVLDGLDRLPDPDVLESRLRFRMN